MTVPKTIDNDLPLPENAPTFGFETARAVGTAIIESLMEDARTTSSWYLAITMGRKSGSLALGMCKSAGATLAVILEEFHDERFDLSLVVDTIVGSIIKRRAEGYDTASRWSPRVSPSAWTPTLCPRRRAPSADAYGHVHIADIPLGYCPARRGARGAEGTRHRRDRRHQGHRLRAALREAGAVRRRIHAHARLRRGALPAQRRLAAR